MFVVIIVVAFIVLVLFLVMVAVLVVVFQYLVAATKKLTTYPYLKVQAV